MFQTIDEKISVAGVYKNSSFVPRKFLCKRKEYVISEVTLISDMRDGEVKKRMYSVLSGRTLYRLIFNRETEIWILEELWVE